MKALIHLKLRQTFDVSFQKTETTNFYEHVPKKVRDSLKHGEAVGLMALSQDQIIFVYRPLLDEETGRTGVTSVRVRWDGKLRPEMLQNHCHEQGVHLIGYPVYEQWFLKKYGERSSARRDATKKAAK